MTTSIAISSTKVNKAGRAAFYSVSFLVVFFLMALPSWANNLTISNISAQDRDAVNDTMVVQFDVSWDNSWRNKINHDAVWLIFKARPSEFDSTRTHKAHCNMKDAGTDPSGTSPGSNTNLEIYVPSDKVGAFLRPKSYQAPGTATSTSVKLKIDYASCYFSDAETINDPSIYGVEMVYIPEGAFYAGDTSSWAAFKQGSSDTDPWYISSESTITVANSASDVYYYQSAGNTYEDATGSTFIIPAAFPKGYQSFYVMKYEMTDYQWVDFMNSISGSMMNNRDITNSSHKNSDYPTPLLRNTVCQNATSGGCPCDTFSEDGYGTENACSYRPYRATSYLNWKDFSAWLDWAGLRPMTELEYEKIARGPLMPVPGEYAWGTTDITGPLGIVSLSNPPGYFEEGLETLTTSGANAHYRMGEYFPVTEFTGGDYVGGQEFRRGMVRAGIFAAGSSTRVGSGAGYYGVMELSGNVWERVVTVGNSGGRTYTGNHGDGNVIRLLGVPYPAAGDLGNADVSRWVYKSATYPERGVMAADGSGFRGGGLTYTATYQMISARPMAAYITAGALADYGGRGVRTYP
ncbi:MAG TPA: hypothetical protein PL155_00015 [Candidatus Omnitrophota bacterium]|nr:hypothetical protein [Candidatus Omnitrophota bacterium]HPD85129.1 hypothetical protein [Candidatus Omnitrophota bacterium]HRZ03987.1 hypothetical protein [Candidatus Omnitrophota bacterium]